MALSSDGNTLAIGAWGNDGNGDFSGHVRVYAWNGTAWQQRGQDIDGEVEVNESGWSVALSSDGNTLAIGAPGNFGNGSTSGYVRVYYRQFPDINIQQLSTDIPSGGTYTFSTLDINNSSESIEFTVQNLGGANLNLTPQAGKLITITGDHPESFTIERGIVNTTIAPGAFETFRLKFTPKVAGVNNAQLTITSNDSDKGTYTINLTGANNNPLLALEPKSLEANSFYPNPGADYVNIKMPVSQGTLRIFNYAGKQVMEQQVVKAQSAENLQLSLKNLSPGLYLIEISNGKDSWITRWVKQP